MLRKPPNRDMAERFLYFVMSLEGQRLWVLPTGVQGGPEQHALHRLPIRPEVYEMYADELSLPNPYDQSEAKAFFKLDGDLQKARVVVLSELMGTALVDQHSDLKSAWKAVIDGGMKPAALAEWNKLPFSESEALEFTRQLEAGGREARKVVRQWGQQFREKYDKVRDLAR
jgi:hypothetical protein